MLRTLFGASSARATAAVPDLPPRLAVVLETPRWDLTWSRSTSGC
jgi:hypothetical protein